MEFSGQTAAITVGIAGRDGGHYCGLLGDECAAVTDGSACFQSFDMADMLLDIRSIIS